MNTGLRVFQCVVAIFAILTLILLYLKQEIQPNLASNGKERIPNILWFNSTHVLPDGYFFARKEIINCRVSKIKSVPCNVHVSWEEHPPDIGAYLFYGAMVTILPQYRNPNVLWGLMFEESPRSNSLVFNEKFTKLFNFSSTFSRYSDVPFPLLHIRSRLIHYLSTNFTLESFITSKEFYVNTTEKNSCLKEIAPIIYIQSNNVTLNDRNKYVLKLMEYIAVDCYGNSIKGKELPKQVTKRQDLFLRYTSRYKFHISIESASCDDYITEKLWRPIYQGVVPIYFGSRTIHDWLPNKKSAILIEDFATPELLAKYLRELLANDTKYEEYLEHKTKGLISNRRLINEFKARPHQTNFFNSLNKLKCALCLRLHEFNSSKINIVSKEALNCRKPVSLLTHAPDSSHKFMSLINNTSKELDDVYNKYMKRIPLDKNNCIESVPHDTVKITVENWWDYPKFYDRATNVEASTITVYDKFE